MTCIDDLFDWILEDIFTKLSRPDRLNCKEVCQRWYTLLMERITFLEDRHIFIKTKEIKDGEAPMSILLNAKFPYQIYTIHFYNVRHYEQNNDLIKLLKEVGASIKELNYKRRSKACDIAFKYFYLMTSLKRLNFMDLELIDTKHLISTINFYNYDLQHLELIQIYSARPTNNSIDFINYIKKFLPRKCTIILSNVELQYDWIRYPDNIEYLCLLMKMTKIKTIRTDDILQIKALSEIDVDIFNCDVLELSHFLERDSPYSILELLQNKQTNLKNIKLNVTNILPPVPIDLPKLTKLTITLEKTANADFPLKPLEQLTNLKSLKILNFLHYTICTFDHESLTMPKLQHFHIKASKLCIECCKALANSFENLTTFYMSSSRLVFNWNIFKLLTDNWKNLQKIYITANEEPMEENFNSSFEPNENLRSIIIKAKFGQQLLKIIKEMSKAYPNLKELGFENNKHLHAPPCSNVIQEVVPAFTNLTTFMYECFFHGSGDIKNKEIKIICDYLNNIGLPVENGERDCIFDVGYEKVMLTFNRKTKTCKLDKWIEK